MYRDDKKDLKNRSVDRRMRMGKLSVLIADNDGRAADLVKRALFNFGFRRIDIARDGDEAMHMLRARQYHLLISEARLKTLHGRSLIKKIRATKNDKVLKRDLPIIMLTADADSEDVRAARDAGINEFVRKPFSARTLADRIIAVIDSPRIFVEASSFSGPCRRRKQPLPPDTGERRKPPPMTAKRVVTDTMLPIFTDEDMKPPMPKPSLLIEANLDMKKEIGMDISAADIITPEVVAEAQAEIQSMETEFISWARDDISQLEQAFTALSANNADSKAHYHMLSTAYAIKSQAGIFGYELGTEVAGMLVSYLTQHSEIDPNNLIVIRKHIDTINAIFNQKIKETGQDIAKEFVLSLMQLIEKLG